MAFVRTPHAPCKGGTADKERKTTPNHHSEKLSLPLIADAPSPQLKLSTKPAT